MGVVAKILQLFLVFSDSIRIVDVDLDVEVDGCNTCERYAY